jgi:CheY-like chemotaxis protein
MAGVITDVVRVLIVDDKPDIRSIVATRLRIEPAFEVVGEAANGAEAMARVGELKPHVMILDLQMPVMSGEEVIPILRSLAPELRIVVFSAYAGAERRLSVAEQPDAEIRKGTGLKPLVQGLQGLIAAPPQDLVEVDLGVLEVECAVRAGHQWARLSPSVREVAMEHGKAADFFALVGVFLALGERLQLAARSGSDSANLRFTTRTGAALAARRALSTLAQQDGALLEPLRSRLLAALPTDPD